MLSEHIVCQAKLYLTDIWKPETTWDLHMEYYETWCTKTFYRYLLFFFDLFKFILTDAPQLP